MVETFKISGTTDLNDLFHCAKGGIYICGLVIETFKISGTTDLNDLFHCAKGDIYICGLVIKVDHNPSTTDANSLNLQLLVHAISSFRHQSCEFGTRSWRGVLDTTLCDKQIFSDLWFSPGTPVFVSTNRTDRHDITEILLKVALNTTSITLHCRNVPCTFYIALFFNLFLSSEI